MKDNNGITVIPTIKACSEHNKNINDYGKESINNNQNASWLIVHYINHETVVKFGNITQKQALSMLEEAKYLLLKDIFND